jgi:oligopeptide/dipeptide ABC transporter ATP-binding protein
MFPLTLATNASRIANMFESVNTIPTVLPTVTDQGGLLRVRNLSVTLHTPDGSIRPVDGVDLDVARGSTVGVVGESGSGKSLLLRAILGLLPAGAEVTGSIRLDDVELIGLPKAQRRRLWSTSMSMVFQDPMTSLDPLQRIETQVGEPLRAHRGATRRTARSAGIALLDALGIPDPAACMRSYPHQLSGGMRQRVSIAMALVCGPRVLLADEPTTALDVTVQAQILRLLRTQQQDQLMGMIFVTHDLGVVYDIADEIAVMYGGQIVERGPTGLVLRSPAMRYTEALLRSRPALDRPVTQRLDTIPGRPPAPASFPSGCRFAERCSQRDERCDDAPALLPVDDNPRRIVRCWHPNLDTLRR